MAQQTQLTRVVPAFERFIVRWPTPADLARSSPEELLRLWDGLGYQRRALNLRRAAAQIADGGWPRTSAALQELPGVGPYTAAAVASFAFGEVVPAVDTNLKRVISRWDGEALSGRKLTDRAVELIDAESPADWNQAIMDLAAVVCRPRNPSCVACPVSEWCADPTIYEPPRRQRTYEGSVRQARAAILKRLAHGTTLVADLHDIPAAHHLESALTALEHEGLIAIRAGQVALCG